MLAEPAKRRSLARAGCSSSSSTATASSRASRGRTAAAHPNGNDYTSVFPEIARAIRALPIDEMHLDGEVVVLDPPGKPSFSLSSTAAG